MKPKLTVVLAFLICCVSTSYAQTGNVAAASKPVKPDTGCINAEKFCLRYTIEGTGLPAMVIGSSLYYPRAFSQNLRKHLRMVFLDHRGFAPSPGPMDSSTFALDILVDDMERARQELGLGRIVVIGHSGHAYMALEYAKKYPGNVSHVVMIGISPDLSAASRQAAERYWQEAATPGRKAILQQNVGRLPDEKLAHLPAGQRFIQNYIRNGARTWYDAEFDATPLWAGVDINMDMFNYVWGRVFRDIDVTKGLETFDRPVFLALGRYDFLIAPPADWDPIKPKFRNLTVHVFERSGHTPQYGRSCPF